ncbi:MAG: SRPBCC family protein [Actinobacteria bacterium]|nr:SRPBCC family protein [Actinomycetota bacterium]
MSNRIEISRDIAASPEEVYAAIADVTRMGEWSIECHTCEWTGDSTGPAVGATFEGHNRAGDKEWTTQATVTEADPGKAFTFECSMFDFHFSTWGYRIEETDEGSRVTEWTEDFLPDEIRPAAAELSGIDDRPARNTETISGTLERLAAALEA